MSDIRNFFSSKPKTQPISKNDTVKNRPKPLLSDSSDDDVVNGSSQKKTRTKRSTGKHEDHQEKKAAKRRLSNSSSDEFEESSRAVKNGKSRKVESETGHPTKGASSKNGASKNHSNGDLKLKPVDVDDFFNSSSTKVKESKTKKSAIKRKSPNKAIEEHDDPSFAAMLVAMDDKNCDQKHKKSPNPKPVPNSSESLAIAGQSKNGNERTKKPEKDDLLLSNLQTKFDQHASDKANETQKNKSPCKKRMQAASNQEKEILPILQRTTSTQKVSSQSNDQSSQEPTLSQQSTQSQSNSEFKLDPGKPSHLWVDKYKPTATKGIIGQQGDRSNMKKLQAWLRGWEKFHGVTASGKPPTKPPPWGASKDDGAWAKAALLSGPPGVGKTTTSYLVAKEMGYEIMETNASDTRSKKKLDGDISDALSSKSVTNHNSKR